MGGWLDRDALELILSFLPEVKDSAGVTLSHRRNKGLLISISGRIAVRKLDLEFYNSGVNDGLPSSVIRESVILRGRLRNHPNVVPLIQLTTPSVSQVRMVYPLAQCNLRQLMESKVSTKGIREITYQLFRGIAFMHSKRVVHRNIRPENIFISVHDGDVMTVQLGDLGQARTLPYVSERRCPLTPEEGRNRTQTDKERARLRYKAPELLLRLHAYSFPIDIWSAGVTVMELMLSGSLPWNHACSDQELIFSIFLNVGTPRVTEWPDGSLCMQLRCGPILDPPNFEAIAKRPDFLLSESNSVWEKLKVVHGAQALLFVGTVLNPIPDKRPNALNCLSSPFVLGRSDDTWLTKDTPGTDSLGISGANRVLLSSRLEYIGGWLFKLARLMDCQTSKPVHLAVDIFERLPTNHDLSPFALLAACLKIAIRFGSSKDMFKQVNCSEIVSACNRAITEVEILSSEQFILNHLDQIADCFDSTLIDHQERVVGSSSTQICLVAQYIGDVCLMDNGLGRDHIPVSDQAAACVVLACQWLGENPSPYVRGHRAVDSFQIAVSAHAQSVSEMTGKIALFDDGLLEKILHWNYKTIIPKARCPVWNTSRSYIESLMEPMRRASTAGTPPKPLLLRRATIEHAEQWAIESRRKKRSRSLTPVRNLKRFRVDDSENTVPSNTMPTTPRRSARLQGKQNTSSN